MSHSFKTRTIAAAREMTWMPCLLFFSILSAMWICFSGKTPGVLEL